MTDNTMREGKLWAFLHDSIHEAYKKLRTTGTSNEYHALLDSIAAEIADDVDARFLQAAQSVPVGLKVSVDVGTGEHDSFNRVFATVTGQQDDGQGGVIILCEEESRNFEQSVPVMGEPVGFILIHENGGRNLTFHDNTDDLADGWSQHKLIIQPTTSITQAELDAKDARIRELEEANASLEASYRGSCMMYDATKAELKALRKDAERYRYLRKQHWSEAEICVVTNPKDAIKLGCYCPSSVRLDSAIDAAMQERQS